MRSAPRTSDNQRLMADHVVIAGGGVGALEGLLAVQAAGSRPCRIT